VIVRSAIASDVADAIRLWNAQLGLAFPLTARVARLTIFEDPTFIDGDALTAERHGEVVGIGWLKRWRAPFAVDRFARTGFIGGLVASRLEEGIGSALLDELEARLRAEGCESVEISGGLLHLLPGVPEAADAALRFFERRGYEFESNLHHDLIGDPHAFGMPAQGVRIASTADEVLDFLAREFPGGWELHARWHLSSGGKPSDFMVLEVDGRVEGFCHIFRPDAWPAGPSTYWAQALPRPAGGLGPIGVSAALRGGGYGRRLMEGSLHELATSGVRGCAIDWTSLVDFYGRFGFTSWRRYRRARLPTPNS
jgi:predicted N-acetyltransferase YhbS